MKKKPVIKAGKEETNCLLGVAGSVKASVHVLVKGKKGESSVPEPAIKGKRSFFFWMEKKCPWKSKRRFLEDGKGKWESAMSNPTLTLLNTPWRERKDSWWMESWGEGKQHNTQCDHDPVTPNMILAQIKASWRGQRWFLLDGIVRGRPGAPNIILACWSCTVGETIPDG